MPDLPNLDGQIEAIGPIRPGDTVILRLRDIHTRQQLNDAIAAVEPHLTERMPGVKFAFLAGVDEIRVYRPAA